MDRLTYSLAEAAEALGVSERTVRRLVANGELPTVNFGRRVLVSRRGLEAMVDRQPAPVPS